MAGRVRVLSERVMIPGMEKKVKKLMIDVERTVRKQDGFVGGEILRDTQIPMSYLILTEWESLKHLKNWFESSFYSSVMKDLNDALQKPTSYRVLRRQKEEIFLL